MLPDAIWVIELNPYAPTTGACLFDWASDESVLRSGPLEMRVVERPLPHLDAFLMPWRDLLRAAEPPLEHVAVAPTLDEAARARAADDKKKKKRQAEHDAEMRALTEGINAWKTQRHQPWRRAFWESGGSAHKCAVM